MTLHISSEFFKKFHVLVCLDMWHWC